MTLPPSRSERIGVVVGSTRPSRICPGIARSILEVAREDSPLTYEFIDLAEVNLPFLDEPERAALRRYRHDHTKAWSRRVEGFDGFVLVFPQYNWGYPAPLKNALDFLYHEWMGKPVSFATYGTRGGNKGAEQIRGVLQGLKMREMADHLEIFITDSDVDGDGQLLDLDGLLRPYHGQIRAIDAQLVEALEDSQ